MAMTKKELAEFELMKTMLALRLHPRVEPDLIPVDNHIINGYTFNVNTKFVTKACSSKLQHGINAWDKVDRHDGISLYSTPEIAYAAMLHEMSYKFAAEMRSVEISMEALKANQ